MNMLYCRTRLWREFSVKKGCGGSDGVQGKGQEYGVKKMTGVNIYKTTRGVDILVQYKWSNRPTGSISKPVRGVDIIKTVGGGDMSSSLYHIPSFPCRPSEPPAPFFISNGLKEGSLYSLGYKEVHCGQGHKERIHWLAHELLKRLACPK